MNQKDRYQQHPEFKKIMRPLSEQERENLTEGLRLEGGAHDPISLWNGFLIDGYNREEICFTEGLRYPEAKDYTELLETEDDVRAWIYRNQLGRRNNTDQEKLFYIGELYNLTKKDVGAPKAVDPVADVLADIESDFDEFVSEVQAEEAQAPPAEATPLPKGGTAEVIAEQQDVSRSTVIKAGQFAEEVNKMPEADKAEVLAGNVSIKEVVKKAKTRKAAEKPAKPEPETPKGKNEVTVVIERYAGKLMAATAAYVAKIREINTEMPALPKPCHLFRDILNAFGDKMTFDLDILAEQFVCEACFGAEKGCAECTFGYVGADTRRHQLAAIDKDISFVGKNTPVARETKLIGILVNEEPWDILVEVDDIPAEYAYIVGYPERKTVSFVGADGVELVLCTATFSKPEVATATEGTKDPNPPAAESASVPTGTPATQETTTEPDPATRGIADWPAPLGEPSVPLAAMDAEAEAEPDPMEAALLSHPSPEIDEEIEDIIGPRDDESEGVEDEADLGESASAEVDGADIMSEEAEPSGNE